MHYMQILIMGLLLLVPLLLSLSIANFALGQISEMVYSPDAKPYGLTYGQWTANWWQWSLGIPMSDNPAGDETGERCASNQNDPNVWFLAGTFGGSVSRTCTISGNRSILIPIVNNECSYLEFPAYKTVAELEKCNTDLVNKASNLQASVDGKPVGDLQKFRFKSELFNFTLPADNVLGLAPGKTDSVAEGYWIMLKPLSKGEHEIKFGGSIVDVSTTSNINFATSATYHITVQ